MSEIEETSDEEKCFEEQTGQQRNEKVPGTKQGHPRNAFFKKRNVFVHDTLFCYSSWFFMCFYSVIKKKNQRRKNEQSVETSGARETSFDMPSLFPPALDERIPVQRASEGRSVANGARRAILYDTHPKVAA